MHTRVEDVMTTDVAAVRVARFRTIAELLTHGRSPRSPLSTTPTG